MATIDAPKVPASAVQKRTNAVRAINQIRYNLSMEFMKDLKHIAKGVKMDTDPIMRTCLKGPGDADMFLGAMYLNRINKLLLDEANREKATTDLLIEDVPEAASKILRFYFLDANFVMAVKMAKRFNIPERLQQELDNAYSINVGMGRTWVAERILRNQIILGTSTSGESMATVVERDGEAHKKMLRQN